MKLVSREPFDAVAKGEVWTVFSDAVQDLFRVWIAPPERGWSGPVDIVIATDAPTLGGVLFGLLTAGRASGELTPAFGISIGYPADGAPHRMRRIRDLTPTRDRLVESWEATRLGVEAVASGGGDAFLNFVSRELRGALIDAFAIDSRRWIIAGTSYGALFAAQALLAKPRSFDSYLLISPALWWDDRAIVREAERGVAPTWPEEVAGSRIFMCAGEEETRAALDNYFRGLSKSARRRIPDVVRRADILTDMSAYADAVSSKIGCDALRTRVLPGFGHGTVVAPGLALGLKFLLASPRR